MDKLSTFWLVRCRHDAPGLLPAARDKVFETYWTTRRGVEMMHNSYRLLDLTIYGRQETWGGLAHWLATTGQHGHAACQWTSAGPVVSPEGRVFG